MSTQEALHVARSLQLNTPTDRPLQAETIWFFATEPPSCRLVVEWHHWEHIARERLFGLDQQDRPTDLVPDCDVVLEAELEADLADAFPSTQADLRVRLADPADPIRATDTWHVTHIQQGARLPDEEELTETVFSTDEDADPKPHVGEFGLRQTTPRGTPAGDDRPVAESREAQTANDCPAVEDSLEPVIDMLETEGQSYEVGSDGQRLHLTVAYDDQDWDVSIEPAAKDEWCTIHAVYPTSIPEDERDDVLSTLAKQTTANWRGRFELECETGTVHYRIPIQPRQESVREGVAEAVRTVATLTLENA